MLPDSSFEAACEEASTVVDQTLVKARFWLDHGNKALGERQRKVLNLLLDAGPGGFEGGMSTKKYENVTGTSRATASRELIDLEAMGLLKHVGGGRSTRYYVALPGWGAAANRRTRGARSSAWPTAGLGAVAVHQHDAGDPGRDAEARLQRAGDAVALHHVADAEAGDASEYRERGALPAPVMAEAGCSTQPKRAAGVPAWP